MLRKSAKECCAEALDEEQLAALFSYRPDRDRYLASAKRWRELEKAALLREANAQH